MIKLHGFGANLGLPDASPFVLKVDAYLKLAGIPFERVSGIANMRGAPKGKLPYITDGDRLVADSSFIVNYLEQHYSPDLDNHLSEQQKATAYLLRSTLEEKLYWCTLYFRWVDEAGWAQVKPLFFSEMPAPLKLIVPGIVRRGTVAAVHKQGTSRHSSDEILSITREVFSSISSLLGDGPFLFGQQPCSTDAVLYAFLAQSTLAEISTPINTLASEFPALKKYSEHFRASYY